MLTKEEIIEKIPYLSAMLSEIGAWPEVLAAMELYANQDKWISCESELPKMPGFYACHKRNGLTLGLYFSADREFRYGREADQTDQVTHWQSLPTPPKQ